LRIASHPFGSACADSRNFAASSFDDLGIMPAAYDRIALPPTLDEAPPMTSQARIEANRRNAMKSTGPKTAEGKARSRLNALTHGLRAEDFVLPTESAAEFRDHLDAWAADWRPPTMARAHLVERAAVASWRLRRCVRVESARLSRRVDESHDAWDARDAAALKRLVTSLPIDPAGVVAALESTRPGVDRLIGLWEDLVAAASEPGLWSCPHEHHARFFHLLGLAPDDPAIAEEVDDLWRFLLASRPDLVDPDEDDEDSDRPLDPASAEAVRGRVLEECERIVARLLADRESLDDEGPARDFQAELDAFAPRPEDAALLRYEGQFDREFRASLNQLTRLTLTGADLVDDDDATPVAVAAEPEAPNEPIALGSSGPGPAAAPGALDPAGPIPGDEAEAPNEPNFRGTTAVAQGDGDEGGHALRVIAASGMACSAWSERSDR